MGSKLAQLLDTSDVPKLFFRVFAAILLLSLFVGVATEFYYLFALPAFLLLVFLTIVDIKKVFLLLVVFLPLSTEFYFPNGFGTDLPTEPLMVGLMLVGLLFALGRARDWDARFLMHPITLLLALHVGWIGITAFTSGNLLVSFKFLLAKIWYVATFYFLAIRMLRNEEDIKTFFWAFFIPLMFTVCMAVLRHATYGFSFADVYKVLAPFYRNHVAYAAIMVLFLPYVWFARKWYEPYSNKWWILSLSVGILLIAIYLSYTRAAYIGVVVAMGAYFIIRWKLTRYVILLAFIGAAVGLVYVAQGNRYLDFAPNYETTTSHQNFDNLLEATYQGEDISTMERVYRWVAGFHMAADQPVLGFGPGNFYTFYKSYTVTSFQTYVSDNPEQSGIHSYYLMTAVEQGIPGLLIFLLLVACNLLYGEWLYHRLKVPRQKQMVMMALLSQIVILTLLIINDLIETDKVGPIFFINLVLLVSIDLYGARRKTEKTLAEEAE
jgi:O-antigen ligase